MSLSSLSLKRPVTTLMITLSVLVVGFVALERLPMESFPSISSSGITARVQYNNSSPEEIRLFLDQWWQSFLQARSEQTTAREKAVERVRKAAAGSAQDVSKAAMALAELENGHTSMETVIRRWARLVRAPAGYTLESLQDATNTYIDRWLTEWGETAAKLSNMVDAYEKLAKHRQMQQEASE